MLSAYLVFGVMIGLVVATTCLVHDHHNLPVVGHHRHVYKTGKHYCFKSMSSSVALLSSVAAIGTLILRHRLRSLTQLIIAIVMCFRALGMFDISCTNEAVIAKCVQREHP